MKVTLTHYTKNPITCIEEAAANCYNSSPSGGLIAKSCYKSGHESVFEFADFTFHVAGVSRSLLAQLTRHRIASYSVRSQRYCDEEYFTYVTPPDIKKYTELKQAYDAFMEVCNETYKTLVNNGVTKEDARMILPNACCTELEMKMNGRELMHFCNERLCARAQWEIRELAKKIIIELEFKAASLEDNELSEFAKYLVPKCEAHGYNSCLEKISCGRHKKLNFDTISYEQLKDRAEFLQDKIDEVVKIIESAKKVGES